MAGHSISNSALLIVINAFKFSPVGNPDGTTGINLHIDNGPDSIMNPVTGETWGSLSQADEIPEINPIGTFDTKGNYNWSQFQTLKDGYFDNTRSPAFHYAISAHEYNPSNHSSGISRNVDTSTAAFNAGASDFLITLAGACTADPCSPGIGIQAGTFMHEFGHNLGLHHGGVDDTNRKPNYLSIMNYAFQFTGLSINSAFRYDYSHYDSTELASLDENKLSEQAGLSPSDATLKTFNTIWYCPDGKTLIKGSVSGVIDWNCDKSTNKYTLSDDLNGDGKLTSLSTTSDWNHLVYTGGGVGSLGAPLLPMTTHDSEPPMSELLEAARVLDPEHYSNVPTSQDGTTPTKNSANSGSIPSGNGNTGGGGGGALGLDSIIALLLLASIRRSSSTS